MNAPKRESESDPVVFVANGEMQAEQVRSFLEAAGIPSTVRGDSFRKLFDISEGESGAVEIFVAPANQARARALLRSAEAGDFRLSDNPNDEQEPEKAGG